MKRTLITDYYRELNRKLHELPYYGVSGRLYADRVRALTDELGTRDVLDYGCGKRTLETALGFAIHNYDPCIAGLDAPPKPADVVACIDVLEHIEPELLDGVLDDLKRLTKKVAFLYIATRPAKKFLSDGRNAHLIQRPVAWWLPKLAQRFEISAVEVHQGAFLVIVRAPRRRHSPAWELAHAQWILRPRGWLRQRVRNWGTRRTREHGR
jgi:hypothetical protein